MVDSNSKIFIENSNIMQDVYKNLKSTIQAGNETY